MTSVNKVQFASLNDKRYYFLGGIVFLPFGHPSLSSLRDLNLIQKFTLIENKKGRILNLENQIVAKNENERLRVLRSIFSQRIYYYKLNSKKKFYQKGKTDFTTTREYILSSKWL